MLFVNDFYLVEAPLLRFFGYRAPIFTWVRIDPSVFGRVGRFWLHFSSLFSDRIIAVSHHIQSLLPERVSSDLLYDPVSAEFLPSPETRYSDKLTFVFVGNYIEGKGQDVAIAAFSQIFFRFPNSRLHFYGGDMGLSRNRIYRERLEAQATSLGVADAITFGDFLKNPRSVLEGAFVALNLSRSESFSRTVLEASACGVPVIATRCGGPAEIVRDGETGIMIPVDNVAACVEAMHSLCIDPDRAAKMGAAGRERVMKFFSPKAFSLRLQALLDET
ncbi:hypothetical protein BMI90_11545 [Thioclava sp. L04-15]|nr:hypothetical protein BMI90_11545 [Thioclava sp. L04-15]